MAFKSDVLELYQNLVSNIFFLLELRTHVDFFRIPAVTNLAPSVLLYSRMYLFSLMTLLETDIDGSKKCL